MSSQATSTAALPARSVANPRRTRVNAPINPGRPTSAE